MSETSKAVSDAVKSALLKVLSQQAFQALVKIAGWGWVFGLPIISTLTQFIIEGVIKWAIKETAVGLSVLWIQLDMAYEVDNAEEGARRLKDMLDNPTKYTEKEQLKIVENFDETTLELIQLSIKRL